MVGLPPTPVIRTRTIHSPASATSDSPPATAAHAKVAGDTTRLRSSCRRAAAHRRGRHRPPSQAHISTSARPSAGTDHGTAGVSLRFRLSRGPHVVIPSDATPTLARAATVMLLTADGRVRVSMGLTLG